MAEGWVAYAFGGVVLAGGVVAAGARQVLYALVGMGLSLLGLAGLFLVLGSPFVAGMQLLIYIGGIGVAIVFALMLSVSMAVRPLAGAPAKTALALAVALLFGLVVGGALGGAQFIPAPDAAPEAWSVKHLGHLLLNAYGLVFEGLALVLLLALVGAVLIARRERAGA